MLNRNLSLPNFILSAKNITSQLNILFHIHNKKIDYLSKNKRLWLQ